MNFGTALRPRLLASLALAALVTLVGLSLGDPGWRPGAVLSHGSYDSLHSLAGVRYEATADSPVVIVYLDLQSFLAKKQDPAHPWPRELHAQLLRRLTAADARAVVFDIVFGAPGSSAVADGAFADAIRDNGRVILAAEYNNYSVAPDDAHDWARLGTIEPLHEPFVRNAAAWGIASQGIDDDNVVRRYVAGFTARPQPSLTWAAAEWLHLPVTQGEAALQSANQHWVRYYGPPLAIPHVSYSQALDPAGVSDEFFHGKIVFIGARPSIDLFNERKDEFRNPFHSWRYKSFFMPGVEVHATEMLNLVRGDRLHPLSPSQESLLLLGAALLFGGGLIWLRPIPATIMALAGAGLTLIVALASFSNGVWFPWLIVSAAQIPAALGGSILFYSREWHRARKRFEAAKKIADAKIREQAALIEKAHDAIVVQSLSGRIDYANPSAERLYGWKLDELQQDGVISELFSPDAEAAQVARAAAIKQGEWNGELRQQTKAGKVVTVASRWTLIRDDANKPNALLLINSDVTEQKQLEAQFLRTQRMNTIGTLAGGMAHDLNNALAPILMGVQLLRRKAKDEESGRMLGLIESNTHRSADMVRQVLLFARGRSGEFERLELGPLVKELEKMVRDTFPKNIAVEAFLPGDLWPVRGNPTQLHQVLLNLCVNARDAMPEGGRLSFAADNVVLNKADAAADVRRRAGTATDEVRLTSATTDNSEIKPGEYVSLFVSDTGTGMPPEVRAKMFEPFFTTKDEGRGTGIGLSTVLRIVKGHGGCLRVESEPGQGTTVEVFLPRAPEPVPATAAERPAEIPRGQGELILVADDERAVRELVSDGLASHGYRVLTAADGEEAIRVFQGHCNEVSLLVTDHAMPVMDGSRAVAEIRKLRPGLPAILTSGEANIGQPVPGDVILLVKPFSLEELLTAVGTSLSKK